MKNSEETIKAFTNVNKKKINILLVDDHPMTIRGYELFLNEAKDNYIFNIDCAYNCDDVINKVRMKFFDLILLDLRLPACADKSFIDGEDLSYHLKKNSPKTKLIIHTSLNDQPHIVNIIRTLQPDGFLIKTDIEPEVLLEAIHSVLLDNTYYSKQTNIFLGVTTINAKMNFDLIDKKILYHLSNGEKMKNLPKFIPMSMSGIERKKKRLKYMLGVPNGANSELLSEAKKHGLI